MSGLIALVDCNNFYASCERLFDPTLRGKPVVVLSNNDGCAIARSNEAKALGIKMGDPWHLNRAAWRRQGVLVRSSNYTLYGDLSRRVAASSFSTLLTRLEIGHRVIGSEGKGTSKSRGSGSCGESQRSYAMGGMITGMRS